VEIELYASHPEITLVSNLLGYQEETKERFRPELPGQGRDKSDPAAMTFTVAGSQWVRTAL